MSVVLLLTSLVAAVAYLLFGPSVPPLHFVTVTARGFRMDESIVTPLPTGTTALNAAHLSELGTRFRDANPQRIGVSEDHASVEQFIDQCALPSADRLIIYCAADVWCIPDKDAPEETVLEILPAKLGPGQEPFLFLKFLSHLKSRESLQTLLLLEFTGRSPGLASGAVADDIPVQIRKEIQRAGVSGLTVICACDRGERSWEFLTGSPSASATATSVATPALPEFHGTAFGHFVHKALAEGKAATAGDLFRTVQNDVREWVSQNFGETQTVWLETADAKAPEIDLLRGTKLPKAKQPEADPENTEKADSSSKVASGPKGNDSAEADGSSTESSADDQPVARLRKLLDRRDALSKQTMTAVLYPAEWLQLHINLLAAERFAMSGNREEFDSLHDDVLRKALKELERNAAELSSTPRQQASDDWVAAESSAGVSAEAARLLRQTQRDFSVEASKAPSRLPDEILENRVLRSALVAAVIRDLNGLSGTMAAETSERKASVIQERVFLMQNLAARWPQGELDVFPEQLATIKEVLSGQDIEWMAEATGPLVQLLELRHQTLQLAAGRNLDGKMLRRDQWQRIAAQVDEVLRTLHSAERWLCVGREGKALTEDRLATARGALEPLKKQVEASTRLIRIRDAQRFELPFLIQYLAMRLEETSLPEKELSAAGNMAEQVISGTLAANDFPVGQLEPMRFTRDHIEAMFQLTRDFSKPTSEVTESDQRHYRFLEQYVDDRLRDPDAVSATEGLLLLTIPHLDREKHLTILSQHRPGVSVSPPEPSGRTGIWMSFWSLRLVDAIEQTTSTDDWQRWRDLVTAISGNTTAVPARRAAMARLLRERWIRAMQKLRQFHNSDVFVPEQDSVQLLSKDVTRRIHATTAENRSLYSKIQQVLRDEISRSAPASLAVLNPDLELSSEFSGTMNVRGVGVAELYVFNPDDSILLTNARTGRDRNWLRLDIGDATDVSLDLRLRNAPQSPTPLTIVAVDKQGAAVSQTTARLLPPARNSWEIEVWEVEKGQPDRQITLQEMQSRNSRRLRLLPSTLDPATKMDMPTQLKLRLRRTEGISKSVRIRADHAGSSERAWSRAEPLVFPDGETVVDIPFQTPAASPAAGTASTLVPGVPEISRGLVFEITPDDLPSKIPSQITITPRLSGPEEILLRPIPTYDSANDELVIPLVRAPFDNSTVLWPSKLPAAVELSPALQSYLRPGTSLTTLNADGHIFRIPFNASEIRKVLSEDGLEFGVSVAGIPHAWWWTLTDGSPRLLEGNLPRIRTFLTVDNSTEVPPVATAPNLLLGAGWDKAKMTARVFIHGGQFDDDWELSLFFLRKETEAPIRARELPFKVTSRHVETVRMSAGENGLWQFSTTTEPYAVSAFTPGQFQLQNGIYDLNAVLEHRESGDEQTTSSLRFTLDSTGPELSPENVKLSQPKTNINGLLKGKTQVTDPESGVVAVRVGLNPEMMVPLTITPGEQVNVEFQLDSSQGFPKLQQQEKDINETVTLYVEADNRAGGRTQIRKPVTFFLPGKTAPMVVDPGTIIVKLKTSSKYDVSLTGKDDTGKVVVKEAPDSAGAVTFDALPPGNYLVKWKPKVGSVSGQEAVKLSSGQTVTIGPGK